MKRFSIGFLFSLFMVGSLLAAQWWAGIADVRAASPSQPTPPSDGDVLLPNNVHLPIIFGAQTGGPAASIDAALASGFVPMQGAILPSVVLTARVTLLHPMTGVSVTLDGETTPGQDVSADFVGLEATGAATATFTLESGVYTLTVIGSADGQPVEASASALLLPAVDGVVVSASEFPMTLGADEEGNVVEHEENTVLLLFGPGASLEEIGNFLRENGLAPLDWSGPLGLARALILSGRPPGITASELQGRHPDLLAATVNRAIEERGAAGERLPPPITANYRASGNANCTAAGNVWRGCIDHTGAVTGTATVFRYHFYMDSFAGHRLAQKLLPNNPITAGLAIVDSGLGNGGANSNADVPAAALFGFARAPWSFSPDSGEQTGGPFTLAHVSDASGHGTAVTAAAAARGNLVLGGGPDISIRPMRRGGAINNSITGIVGAVIHPRVQAVNTSWGWTNPTVGQRNLITTALSLATRPFLDWGLDRTPGTMDAGEGDGLFTFTDANGNGRHDAGEASERFFDGNGNGRYDADDGRIVVMAMDNQHANHGLNSVPDGYAPSGVRTAASYLAMAVCATGTDDAIRGPEHFPTRTAFGPNHSVSAPGKPVVLPNQNGVLNSIRGCSFSAPLVAGLVTELRMLDRNLNADAANRLTPLQIIELVEATADDLGTTFAGAADVIRPNDAPGNGFDNYFGHGRINIWKATLAVVNRGIAAESHTAASRLPAANYPSLATIADNATRWYGFRIHSPIHNATVWIDGVQVTDAGATAPGGIAAYAGVRTDRVIQMGIDDDHDRILDEDPTSDVVPLGSKSTFLVAFSIERSDLVKGGGQRTLSLRRPGQGPNDPPFFNLELDLLRMRKGGISGVVFDDFVFEITLPDWGDGSAPYPVTEAFQGGNHVNNMLEYFGRMNNSGDALMGVSSEQKVYSFNDPDGVGNWSVNLEDLDGLDNGVVFYPLTYLPGGKGRTDFRVCVAETGARYDKANRNKQIFVNGWIDWNTNGSWEEGATREHVLNGLRLAPVSGAAADWEPLIAAGENISATVTRLASNDNCAEYKAIFDLPATMGKGKLEARWRLDYGENVGRHANTGFSHLPGLDLTRGPARFGEVEDYIIGPDFGDAPDGPYPTKKGSNGPRHLSFYREWIGPFSSGNPTASREPDACNTKDSDQDGVDNLGNGCGSKDRDGFDDFVVTIIAPGKIQVDFSVSAAVEGYGFDGGNGGKPTLKPNCSLGGIAATPDTPLHQQVNMRYDANNPAERLYVNLWADWNGDGVFETHLIAGAPVDPEDFGADGAYTLGEQFVDANKDGVWNPGESFTDAAGVPTRAFSCKFDAPVPPPPGIEQWLRLRLDYGENEGQFIRRGDPFEEEPLHVPAAYTGGAVWGEVEDTPISAGPRKISMPTSVKPKDSIRYTLVLPGNPELTGSATGTISDILPSLVTFVDGSLTASSGEANYNPAAHAVEWAGELTAETEVVVQFDVTVVENPPLDWPTIVNRAQVFDGVALFTVEARTELVCIPTKRTSQPVVTPGQVFRFDVALPNLGETPVTASIFDPIPASLQFMENLTCSHPGCSFSPSGNAVTWNGILPPGEQVIVSFDVVVPPPPDPEICPPPSITNSAMTTVGGQQETVSANVAILCGRAPTTTP